MSSSQQIPDKIPCLLSGTSTQAPLKRQSSIHTPMESQLLISMKMEVLSLHSAKPLLQLNKLSRFGDGRIKIHAISQHKWTKKQIACKNSLSSITTKGSLQLQVRRVFSFGFGRIVRGDLSFTHHRSQQRKPSHKQSSSPTLHKQSQAQKRVS